MQATAGQGWAGAGAVHGRGKAPCTPRHDFQGISGDADLQAIMARLPQFTTAS